MAWRGSEALDYDLYESSWEEERVLVAHEGGHLDDAARRGVSSSFMRAVRAVIAVAVVACLIGAVCITFTAEAVKAHHANAHAVEAIEEMRMDNDELRLACEQLTRSERIARIATQNLNMTYATEADRLEVR